MGILSLSRKVLLSRAKAIALVWGIAGIYFGFLYWDAFPCRIDQFKSAEDFMARVPSRHIKRMESVFREILFRDGIGYVLAGYKPMGFYSLNSPPVIGQELSLGSCERKTFQRVEGWGLWFFYQKALPQDKIVYTRGAKDDLGFFSFYAFHKKTFFKIAQEHEGDIIKVLGAGFSPDALINLAGERDFVEGVIQGHEGLLGTFLGYGRGNAWLFYENRNKSRWERPANMQFAWKDDKRFEDIEVNCSGDVLKQMPLPGFVADPSTEETQVIKDRYLQARKEVIKQFANDHFFRAIIESSFTE